MDYLGKFGESLAHLTCLPFQVGAVTFPLFVGGLWYYDATGQPWFAILGGVIGGMSAGLLWTVSGFMWEKIVPAQDETNMVTSQFAYAEENDKGSYIAWQLFLLTVGSTVGALVVFGITINDVSLNGVPISVYITFIIIMASATIVRRVNRTLVRSLELTRITTIAY